MKPKDNDLGMDVCALFLASPFILLDVITEFFKRFV